MNLETDKSAILSGKCVYCSLPIGVLDQANLYFGPQTRYTVAPSEDTPQQRFLKCAAVSNGISVPSAFQRAIEGIGALN